MNMATGMALAKYLNKETRDLLDFVLEGVYVVDTERRIAFWNRGAQNLTGYTPEEVVGRFCRDGILNHIDENGTRLCWNACPLLKAIESDTDIEEKVYPLNKAGQRFPVITHVGPIKDKDGTIIGGIEVFRDVSFEEKLKSMERKFDRLIKQYVSDATYDSVRKTITEETLSTAATVKDFTVLFMDIVGFTSLSEKRSPEEVVKTLNSYFSMSSHIIKQHLGDIDKFIGDCVMATFIEAQNAVDTASEFIRTGLPDLNEALRLKGLPEINVRIGINSGKLVQGDIGSEDRKDMTVIGDVVNTASRIESVCEPGNFMISENSLVRLDNPHHFEFVQELLLKGKTVRIKLYRPK